MLRAHAWLGRLALLGCWLLLACGGVSGLPAPSPSVAPDDDWLSCTSSSQCPKNLPTCDPVANVCTGCILGSCSVGKQCDLSTHLCAAITDKCTSDYDCPISGVSASNQNVCNVSTGSCVECLTDDNCVSSNCDSASNVCVE